MSILGYHMTWKDERKYLTFHCSNGKSCRDIKLHDEKYLKDNIERELLQREFPDSGSDEKQPTGWEDSRELYEQHLRERALAKAETRRVSDSYLLLFFRNKKRANRLFLNDWLWKRKNADILLICLRNVCGLFSCYSEVRVCQERENIGFTSIFRDKNFHAPET